MEKPGKRLEGEALDLAIEENRLRMHAAWVKAQGLNNALQSAKQNGDYGRSRHFARKKSQAEDLTISRRNDHELTQEKEPGAPSFR